MEFMEFMEFMELLVSPGAKDGMEQLQALATRQRPVSVNAPLGG